MLVRQLQSYVCPEKWILRDLYQKSKFIENKHDNEGHSKPSNMKNREGIGNI